MRTELTTKYAAETALSRILVLLESYIPNHFIKPRRSKIKGANTMIAKPIAIVTASNRYMSFIPQI